MYRMVFTQIFRRLVEICFFISLFSCSAYRTLQVEILQPAKIPVEKGKQIALLDRNIRRIDCEITYVDRKSELYIVEQFARGINQVFTEMNHDTILSLKASDRKFIEKSRFPKALSMDSVNRICQEYHLDYIISIEMQDFLIRHSDLICMWFMRLYKAGSLLPLDSIKMQYTLPLEEEYGVDEEDIKIAFWDEGAAYAQRIVPYWQKVERRVYTQGRALRLGDYYLQNEDTEKAIQIWEGAVKLSNKLAVKAGINLAWIYENAGDFQTAQDFLLEAEKIASEHKMSSETVKYLKDYIKMMAERIRQKEVVNSQMDRIGD